MSLAGTFDPGPAAEMYGQLAAVLAGFAMAGLVLYLERQKRIAPEVVDAVDQRVEHISAVVITKTLFYAMSALVICAFLYSRLAGEGEASGPVVLAMMLYGVVLGTSVLSLFYALSLVMLTHEVTREAAWTTRWVIAAMGPAVVMSFLAGISGDAWALKCGKDCAVLTSPRFWGFLLIAIFVAFGLWLTSSKARRTRPFIWTRLEKPAELLSRGVAKLATTLKRPGTPAFLRRLNLSPPPRDPHWPGRLRESRPALWLLLRPWVQHSAKVCRRRPHLPAELTLFLASFVGVNSLWVREIPDSFEPPYWLLGVVFVLAVLVMAIFAFATGSVLDDEPEPKWEEPGDFREQRPDDRVPG
ncbi:MAG: hypothetical protein ACRDUA_04920 [Micromonosporaceae bacterium]